MSKRPPVRGEAVHWNGNTCRVDRQKDGDPQLVEAEAGKRESMTRVGRSGDHVEVDHSRLDIMVLDDRTGVVLDYPRVTVAVDHYSRMLLAAHLDFKDQSLEANLQCLRTVMSPEGYPGEFVPKPDFE